MKSNVDWKEWGRFDPLYGVATIPGRSKGEKARWTKEEVYKLGLSDWSAFRQNWERYGVSTETCLEIGCGVGRMTKHLAEYFTIVHATDVSAEMIEYASHETDSPNIHFHLTNGVALPLPAESVQAVFSTHVFQHFERVEDGVACFREIYRVMKPGATLMIHLPVVMWPWGTMAQIHRSIEACRIFGGGLMMGLRRLAWGLQLRKAPPMHVIWYEVNWLRRRLVEIGFSDAQITVLFCESTMALQHPFVFARK